MYFGGFIIDSAPAAEAYQKLMYDSDKLPFDYEKMSKALHPDDWDPQNSMVPMDMEDYWARDKKPAGYELPTAWVKAKKNGELEKVAAEYKKAFTSDPWAEVRSKCKGGGKDILA